ncbi:hypothetical protein [Xanthobacter sp.]|uniref:hypothetical protein n=1 Tax=Xanthobacter sp. TaxID=35809 RepID=UPI0025F45433|nr:hypothetical protein [Xanthobacter sp.]
MKVRMLVSMAGVDFALSPGDVTERFGDEEATRLVQADYAVVIAAGAETTVQVPMGEVRSGVGGEGADPTDQPAGEGDPPAAPTGDDEPPATSDAQPEAEAAASAAQSAGEGEPPAAPSEANDTDDKAALQAEAEALGVDVDKRWGVARLKSEIEAAKAKAAG